MMAAADIPEFGERDVRAAAEPMDVVENDPTVDGADHMYAVYHRGTRYIVDLQEGACQCPDASYRGSHCKHLRRVEMELGERDLPPGGVRLDRSLAQKQGGRDE